MTKLKTTQVIPKAVLEAALALHKRRNKDLIYSPFSNAEEAKNDSLLYRCTKENEIEFTNLEARNYCVAQATFQQVMPMEDTDEIFDVAFKLWRSEIGHSDTASGHFLSLANQNVNVLLGAVKTVVNKNRPVFDVLHLLESALPHLLNIRAEDLVNFIDVQYESTKNDLARGMIFNAIESRLQSEPQLAWEIWRLTRTNMSESVQNLYGTSLHALMHTDQQFLALKKAKEDADHNNPQIATIALWVLGRAIQAHQLNDNDLNDCIEILINKSSLASTEIQKAAIHALAQASLKDDRLMSKLLQLAAEHNDYTLTVIAAFLLMNFRNLSVSAPYFNQLLQTLVWLSPSQKSAINNFDWVLHQLYAMPEYRQNVLDYLTQWITQHGSSSMSNQSSIELFEQTIIQIANDMLGLQTIITRWLFAPEKQLAIACNDLISYLEISGGKSLRFSPEVLDTFTTQDFKFLACRLLGYVLSERPLLSLTLSMLETVNAPERSFGLVYELLTKEVGRDYEHATIEALNFRKESADSPEKELLEQIHYILMQRRKALDDLPNLQELRPPMRLRRAITLNRAREMEKSKDLADKKSILGTIATVIPIKAGTGCFSIVDNQVGPTHHLQSFSHSITLPKRALTDPTGYAITGLYYRIAKRDEK